MRLAYDIETDGLLPKMKTIHCINAIDVDTGQEYRFNDHEVYPDPRTGLPTAEPTNRNGTIADGIKFLESATMAVAQNGLGFDFPVLELIGGADFSNVVKRDTQVCSMLIWTNLKDLDFARIRKGKKFESKHIGQHRLAAWGQRLGNFKKDFSPTDYGHTWETYPFSKDCDDYCMQDVAVLVDLWKLIESKGYSEQAIQLEHEVKEIIYRQEQHGWLFDLKAAQKLTSEMQQRRLDLEVMCRSLYHPFYVQDGAATFTPKRDNKKMGYAEGAPLTKVKVVDFNPGSRAHVANRLQLVEGWEPVEHTPTGLVQIDETILSALPYKSAALIAEYMTTVKRLGQMAEGKGSWLNKVQDDGRMRGRVHTNGAVTGRMTHTGPNMANVDKYPPMRALFTVPPGKKLVGTDADGLELRCMGHYLYPYDGGAFVKTILEGNSADGTDMHTRNQIAIKFNSRNNAKTFFYAMIYGAGNYKLGTTVVEDMTDDQKEKFYAAYPAGDARKKALVRLGGNRRACLIKGITGMETLIKKIQAASKRGFLKGIDGRLIHVRSAHAALNTLFQSAGAVLMKQALVIADQLMQREGLVPGTNYEFVGNIHDEFQQEVDEDYADFAGTTAATAIKLAGETYGFRCPLAGNYNIGSNWAETH